MTTCWIVTEGIAGTENQCLGVAEALGVMPEIKRINLRQPWKSLSPYLGFESPATFTGDRLETPWPDLVLASGRKSIAAARYIKKASGGKSFVVQIQDPRVSSKQFDLVAVPAHDPSRGDNVIVTTAAPNRIQNQRLDDARKEFAPTLSKLPEPRVTVLIGGNSKAYQMTQDITSKLAKQLRTLADQGHGLMVTASRRTGTENEKILKEALDHKNIYYWDGSGDNPYFGFLAWADFILVTADSVSMLSEAATTGKPVYMVPLEGGTKRFQAFHDNLLERGIIRRFEDKLTSYDYTSLDDAGLIAKEIQKHLNKLQ